MTGDDIRTAAAALAVGVSLISLVITRLQAQKAERLGRRPVLVVRANKQNTEWAIENIGKGPALDIIVYQQVGGRWHALRMPEVAADGSAPIPARWFKEGRSCLMLRYRSVADAERYVTRVHGDRSEMSEGWKDVPVTDGLRSHREFL
jgi:hypothetical protein